jgi:hypothetical protein
MLFDKLFSFLLQARQMLHVDTRITSYIATKRTNAKRYSVHPATSFKSYPSVALVLPAPNAATLPTSDAAW